MSSGISREELVESVLTLSRRSGAQIGLFTQAVADRLGLAGSDIDCLDILSQEGRLTVGRLSELLGLTTGSTTRMVDRLEQAGFVRRVPDPTDRRRVMVETASERMGQIAALHESLKTRARDLTESLSDAELQMLAAYLEKTIALFQSEAVRLREPASEGWEGGSSVGPLAGATSGRLLMLTGAPRMAVTADASIEDLYHAEFAGAIPRMRVRDGVVTVAYQKFGWFDWRAQIAGQFIDASAHWQKDAGKIVLNASIPWAIEMRGGVSTWTGDLRALRLESFEMKGGASEVELRLGDPVGVVPLRILGAVNRLSIERPKGTAAGLEVRGGINELEVDGQAHHGGAGTLSLQSPGAAANPNRYEIEIKGGANRVTVSTR